MKKIFEIKKIDNHKVFYLFNYPFLKVRNKNINIDIRRVTSCGLNAIDRNKKIIVSLTTFPARINKVHLTIEHILTQTIKPDMVILWLSPKEFPNKEQDLPESLLRLKEFGLSIEWCEFMRSYQKIIPTMEKYPNDIIITVDDDFYYPKDLVEKLYVEYLKNPNFIHAHRVTYGTFQNNKISTLSNHEAFQIKNVKPSYLNFLMGYGGVLYPANALDSRFADVELFKNLIPTHDDIWLWAMAVLNGTKINQVGGLLNYSITTIEDTQNEGLRYINKKGDSIGMDTVDAYNKILNEFPQIKEILSGEEIA